MLQAARRQVCPHARPDERASLSLSSSLAPALCDCAADPESLCEKQPVIKLYRVPMDAFEQGDDLLDESVLASAAASDNGL